MSNDKSFEALRQGRRNRMAEWDEDGPSWQERAAAVSDTEATKCADRLAELRVELNGVYDHIAMIRRTREALDDLYDRKAVTGGDGPLIFAELEAAHVAFNLAVRVAIDPSLCQDRAHHHTLGSPN